MKTTQGCFLLLLAAAPVLARLGETERKILFVDEDTAVENTFIVGFNKPQNPNKAKGLLEKANQNSSKAKARLHVQYGKVLNGGFSFSFEGKSEEDKAKILEIMQKDRDVAFIEQDEVLSLDETTTLWGLDRIDDVTLDKDGTYNPFNNCDASNVRAYVIDTGIRSTHNDFGGRVDTASGYNFFDDNTDTEDCQGHGSHVAGTIGGDRSGVASGVTLIPVKVFGCTGSSYKSITIKGIDHAAVDCNGRDCVASMSLGGSLSLAQNAAVAAAHDAGVVMVTSAGNDYAVDACSKSPASEPKAITVGSTTKYDTRSSFSNIGTCVDIFAPGSSISSVSYLDDTSFTTKSGTSMSCPHVSGAAACYLGANPGATPAAVASFLDSTATVGAITDVGAGSPNKLLYIGQPESPPTTTTQEATTSTTEAATTVVEPTTLDVEPTTTTQATVVGPTTTNLCTCASFDRRRACARSCDGACQWDNGRKECATKSAECDCSVTRRRKCGIACGGTCQWDVAQKVCATSSAPGNDCSTVTCSAIGPGSCRRNACCAWSRDEKTCRDKQQ